MVYLAFLTFVISLFVFAIGLINPFLIFRKENVSRWLVGVVLGGISILLFSVTLIALMAGSEKTTPQTQGVTVSAPVQTFIPIPAVSPSPPNNGVLVKVTNVVDGDTIKIETGQTVRYIGIDTPETVSPGKPIQCYGKEASDKNTELVEGKVVKLEKDISETDKYGRLLRYIWLDDVLINELLVREGYAQSSSYPPDVKYQDRLVKAQELAREEQKGLWGIVCATQNTSPPPSISPTTTTPPTAAGGNTGNFSCNCSKTCAQMSCAEAQYQLDVCGCTKRDADGDGIACDSDCQ